MSMVNKEYLHYFYFCDLSKYEIINSYASKYI